MNGNELLTILIQTIKSRLTGLVTKIKLYTSWNFIRTKIVVKIRDFFYNLLGVKPRNKDDYITIGRWMISKRLMYAAVIIVGVVSLWYISTETKIFSKFEEEGVRTYKYNALRLRTAKGHVRITGKSGYLAYDGEVDDGYVTGNGTLYNPEGNVVYSGAFVQNKYEGNGVENYENGNIHYRGTFHENKYEGTGSLYRENGTKEYDGEFLQGKKNGAGVLYDVGENEIYNGNFLSDNIVYSEFLGKTAEEIQACYKGARELYMTDDESVVVMEGINALYYGTREEDALDDSEMVQSIYVLQNKFQYGNDTVKTIEELTGIFGKPVYEGNSNVILPEAVAINLLNKTRTVLQGPVDMKLNQSFSDAAEVRDFDSNYVVYIYSYQRGEVVYSFVCGENKNSFEFYYLTSADEEENA